MHFLKSFKISIDFIPNIRYNNKCKEEYKFNQGEQEND